jgi:hypothetical protein
MFSFHDKRKFETVAPLSANVRGAALQPYRYAVYFTPSVGTDWHEAGSRWLGRYASSGQSVAQPRIEGIAASTFAALTEDPRRYGWHATLKAPFRLAKGMDEDALAQSMRQLADTMTAFSLPTLRAGLIRNFLAVRPEGDLKKINAIARACTTALHQFVEPLTPSELQRRRNVGLTAEQDRLLMQWGYPWVLDQFQFHFSITSSLNQVDTEMNQLLLDAAKRHFETLEKCRFEQLSLFVEPAPGENFLLVKNFPLKS